MHRDIKPSNVLVNHQGQIKLCDFGVSGELVNSIADTFVGTSTYMAPERIQGAKYSIKSDVWSVGLMLMELAIGRFPFDANESAPGDRKSAAPMGGILDLLQQIVLEPAPKLPESDAFPPYLHDMIAKCLLKDPNERPTPRQLFVSSSFVLQCSKQLICHRTRTHSYKPPNGLRSTSKNGRSRCWRSTTENLIWLPSCRQQPKHFLRVTIQYHHLASQPIPRQQREHPHLVKYL